jgi:hypothetical protein
VAVRIRLEQSGGFAAIPGLQRPVEVDTAGLPSAEAAALEELVGKTGLLAGSLRSVSDSPTGADQREYTLAVTDTDARGERTVHLRDPIDDPAVAALLDLMRGYRGRTQGEP